MVFDGMNGPAQGICNFAADLSFNDLPKHLFSAGVNTLKSIISCIESVSSFTAQGVGPFRSDRSGSPKYLSHCLDQKFIIRVMAL
jgi:hypothetical protein